MIHGIIGRLLGNSVENMTQGGVGVGQKRWIEGDKAPQKDDLIDSWVCNRIEEILIIGPVRINKMLRHVFVMMCRHIQRTLHL